MQSRGFKILLTLFGILVLLSPATAASNLTAGDTVAYYKFEEVSSPYLDATPTGADIDLGTATPTQGAGIISFGQVFSADRIYTTTSIVTGSSGSISTWIKPSTQSGSDWYIYFSDAAGDRTLMGYYGNNNGYEFWVDGNTNIFGTQFSGGLPTTSWTHLVMTWTPTTQKLYRDGSLVTTASTTPATSSFTESNFGCHTNGVDCWDGSLDEISIWNVSLSLIQVSELYNGGSPGSNQQYPYSSGGGGGTNSTNGTSSQTGAPANFLYNLTYNASNARWTYDWSDLDGTMNLSELQVWYYGNNTYTMFASNSSSSTQNSVYLDVTSIENNTMRGFAYLTDYTRTFVGGASTIQVANLWVYATPPINYTTFTIDEPEGVFWAMTIIGSMMLMALPVGGPAVSLMMGVGGLFITSALGLLQLSTGILMLVGLMGGILIWRLRR